MFEKHCPNSEQAKKLEKRPALGATLDERRAKCQTEKYRAEALEGKRI